MSAGAARGEGAPRRFFFDRLAARIAPRWIEEVRPAPREIAPGLWSIDRLLRLPAGPDLPTRGLLVALPSRGLLAWSPVPLDPELQAFVAAHGGARVLVAPNSFHYLGIAPWKEAFPDAAVWLAPGLRARRPEIPPGQKLVDGVPTPFADVLPHFVLSLERGISEVAFLYHPSRTLILTDTVFHICHARRRRDRIALRLTGVLNRFGPTPTARWTLLRDRAAVRAWVERLCTLDFSRVVMAHGEIADAGLDRLRRAFERELRA